MKFVRSLFLLTIVRQLTTTENNSKGRNIFLLVGFKFGEYYDECETDENAHDWRGGSILRHDAYDSGQEQPTSSNSNQ